MDFLCAGDAARGFIERMAEAMKDSGVNRDNNNDDNNSVRESTRVVLGRGYPTKGGGLY